MTLSSSSSNAASSPTYSSPRRQNANRVTDNATVTRVKYLELERQLSTERITFLRELNTLRMSLEMAQLKENANSMNRTSSSMSPNIPVVSSNNISGNGVEEYASPLMVGGGGGGGLRRFASNVNFGGTLNGTAAATMGQVRSNDNTPVPWYGGGTSLTSAPSLYFHNVPSPVVASPPPPPPPPPELISMRLLSEALSSAQLLNDMRELHTAELREKDTELQELREQLDERYREGEAQWHLRLRSVKHEARQHMQNFEQERDRIRVESIASVGDALRNERELVVELRTQTAALQEQITTLHRTLEERDAETRSLRVQITNLQQERVVAGLERHESRGALMAMSSEKIALERRVRQLEQSRSTNNNNNNGGSAGQRRKSEAVRSPGQLNLVVGGSRRSISISRIPSRDGSVALQSPTGSGGPQPRPPQSAAPREKANSTGKAKALDNILDFALDNDMAQRIRSSLQQQPLPGSSNVGGGGAVAGTSSRRASRF
ncbi:Hypothetical protein, putative [Bodo saltans]|uniref:Uncharacterized protein n=1 Tax=Bodo saltans TaxID=75058 RepID=A0A0S4IH63_BODSA|nr:Hypothetical protein, putative [Bodo saltans]|eukprot:CUE58857.1 Hypothetical protein, putative [Bodo saltans]